MRFSQRHCKTSSKFNLAGLKTLIKLMSRSALFVVDPALCVVSLE